MTLGKRLRLWLALNGPLSALAVVLLVVGIGGFVLVSGMIWGLQRQGPPERVDGVVSNFGMAETDQGSYRVMVVQTADGRVTVRAPVRRDCRVGDRAVLNRAPIRLGAHYSVKSCHAAADPTSR